MNVVYAEIEITFSLSALKIFKVYTDFDIIASKINPKSYKTIVVIKGDGGVGSIKSMTDSDGKRPHRCNTPCYESQGQSQN
ncbi:putative START-like domain superfamily protein [Helianthus anomalus]